MKKFFEELRGARSIEWFLAVLAIAILLLMLWNGGTPDSTKTAQEQRLTAILKRIDGVGHLELMISDEPQCGVLVVAEGADNLEVCLRLQYALQTLTGIDAGQIEIVPYQK